MQHFDIIRRTQPKKSFRVANVIGTYDLQTSKIEEHFVGDLDLPEKWNIGLIVGRSGSGKTTIARELFGDYIIDKYDYTHDNILDDMPSGVPMTDIYKTLNSCGFSSPPSWLKPYSVLSNGEKMRCDIARACLEQRDMIVFDEFTSVVDRTVAQIGSFALQKAIRRNGKKFIAVTCHYDVQDWLMPDWVFNTDTMTFQSYSVEEQKKNRPSIELRIHEVSQAQDKERMWNVFRKYHYLNYGFNKAAKVFIAYANGALCAFCAVLPFPHPTKKNTWREHRTVVLPDYQGIGIGHQLSNWVAQRFADAGKTFITTTSNPSMCMARKKDPLWITTRIGRSINGIKTYRFKGTSSCNRITCAFEYIGRKNA
jgi:ABC-type lipoprotein export system ATPase subunit/GNAT superfamily N-acetyltransferase